LELPYSYGGYSNFLKFLSFPNSFFVLAFLLTVKFWLSKVPFKRSFESHLIPLKLGGWWKKGLVFHYFPWAFNILPIISFWLRKGAIGQGVGHWAPI